MRKKDFKCRRNAESFAKSTKGRFIDLTKDPKSKANFRVYYEPETTDQYIERTTFMGQNCPEEGRDFGYPNSYWQD